MRLPNLLKTSIRLGLRGKLTFGFVILAAVSIIYAFLESHEIALLAQNINKLLDDSYRSVVYCQSMELALSDLNRVAEFSKNSTRDEFTYEHSLLQRAKKEFEQNFDLASDNVHHPHEREALDTLYTVYEDYCAALTERLAFYERHQSPLHESVEGLYPELLKKLSRVRELNEKGLYQALAFLKDAPYRALRPGVIVIIVGLLFMLMFSYLVNHYFVAPIKQIIESIRRYQKFHTYQSVPISSDDEILELRRAVDRLVQERTQERIQERTQDRAQDRPPLSHD